MFCSWVRGTKIEKMTWLLLLCALDPVWRQTQLQCVRYFLRDRGAHRLCETRGAYIFPPLSLSHILQSQGVGQKLTKHELFVHVAQYP